MHGERERTALFNKETNKGMTAEKEKSFNSAILPEELVASMADSSITDQEAPESNNNNNDVDTNSNIVSSFFIRPNPSSLPKAALRSFRIGGVDTEIGVQLFQERVVVTCSQRKGRIGHWVLCKVSSSSNDILHSLLTTTATFPPNNPDDNDNNDDMRRKNKSLFDWDVSHLLGVPRDDPLLSVYCKQVSERIVQQQHTNNSSGGQPPLSAVLIGLTLDTDNGAWKDPAMFHAIVNTIVQVYANATVATR